MSTVGDETIFLGAWFYEVLYVDIKPCSKEHFEQIPSDRSASPRVFAVPTTVGVIRDCRTIAEFKDWHSSLDYAYDNLAPALVLAYSTASKLV